MNYNPTAPISERLAVLRALVNAGRKAAVVAVALSLIGCGQPRTITEFRAAHPHGQVTFDVPPIDANALGVLAIRDLAVDAYPDSVWVGLRTVKHTAVYYPSGAIKFMQRETVANGDARLAEVRP